MTNNYERSIKYQISVLQAKLARYQSFLLLAERRYKNLIDRQLITQNQASETFFYLDFYKRKVETIKEEIRDWKSLFC